MGKSLRWIGAGIGGLIGFSTPTAFGQIPPLTALPEEVFTVPIGTAIGAIVGYLVGDAI